tara:strand:- start:1308 stop:2555 length:1248 start_codon:yes stop_codon:yes gene_type:complete
MSFSCIIKISLFFSFFIIYSCQDTILSLNTKNDTNIEDDNINYEVIENLDFSFYEFTENNGIDIYTAQPSNFNFLDKDLNKIKINHFEKKNNNLNIPINVIYYDDYIYSINSKTELVKFDIDTGKLVERFKIELNEKNNEPVSFSLYNGNFIIGFKSGKIIKVNRLGQIIWMFNYVDLLNTPIKIYGDKLIVLYSENIIFLEPNNGKVIFKRNYKSNNIIQSSGGKIENYYNILFFILSNSEFNSLDTLLFEEHNLKFDKVTLNTSLNNLKDQIHIYKNFLVYLDNGNIFHTFDINKNRFILTDHIISEKSSVILFNNALISKNENYINFYNIKNGNLFSKINIKNILSKKSNLIKALLINNRMHLFTNNGEIIILNQQLNIENTLNINVNNIKKIYSYQNKIFINTLKGITYIY